MAGSGRTFAREQRLSEASVGGRLTDDDRPTSLTLVLLTAEPLTRLENDAKALLLSHDEVDAYARPIPANELALRIGDGDDNARSG